MARRKKHLKTHALLLVGLLLVFSLLATLSLEQVMGNLVGYSVMGSDEARLANSTSATMMLYILGFLVLGLLMIYSVLLWKHYF